MNDEPTPAALAVHRRLVALDLGARRTGVAVSDELGLFAHERPAIEALGPAALLAAVQALVAREDAGEVVVGLPLTLAGRDSDQTREARAVVAALRAALAVPVTTWDERLTTAQAERDRRASGRRSRTLDSAAAALVLQAVLDSRRGGLAR